MDQWGALGLGTLVVAGGGAAAGYAAYRSAMAEAKDAYARVAADRDAPAVSHFHPDQLAGLPEIALRYFRQAIAPGTPLYSAAELEMDGTFLLGDKEKYQTYSMTARQALRAPDQFVWVPRMRSGLMTITGSDALVAQEAWTRFWLLGLVPVANERTSPDIMRSAQFRAAVEGAMWIPPSLLPANGAEWEQLGEHQARVTLRRFDPAIVFAMTIDEDGRVREFVGQRWSNANADKVFQLQPFGGTMLAEGTFQGLTIPTQVAVGNHFGTADYLPFFQARITTARFLGA
jgi:hypothetical protein